MKKIDLTAQVHVNAPLQTAFDYVSDLTKHPEWSGGELTIEAANDSPIAVGKEYRSKGSVAVEKERPNQVTVSVYEPPNKFGFISKDADFGNVHHLFTFVEKDGRVVITRITSLSLKPWMAPLFRILIYPLIGRPMTNKSLARLKEKLG